MNLNLKRPIAFIDLETTGINVSTDRIVEISVLKISPNGKEEWMSTRVNPEMPIPPKTTAIHGITDEDVADSPTFKEIAKNLAAFLEGCDLAGYNAIKFDIPVLAEEFLRTNIDFNFRKRRYVDVQVIFHKKEHEPCLLHTSSTAKKNLKVHMVQKLILLPLMKFLNRSSTDIRILKMMLKNLQISVPLTTMLILPEGLYLMKMELRFSISENIREKPLSWYLKKNLHIIHG